MKGILVAALPSLIVFGVGLVEESVAVEGTLSPAGAPAEAPVRVDAGGECVVDLTQRYNVDGGLTGELEIDYRILAHGPCGSPAGTFDEEWIAHGTLAGRLAGNSVSGTLVYTAEVRDGGKIRGTVVFGDGLAGKLAIQGRFADGKLSYSGSLSREPGVRSR